MELPSSQIAKTLEDTALFARNLLEDLNPRAEAAVIALSGDLGAGKTAFTKELAALLGISKEDVTSPTFVIEKIYEINHPHFAHLIHVDAYRLESEDELIKLGWQDIVSDPKNLIVVEWPERISSLIPQSACKIGLKALDNEEREITFL